MRATLGAGEHAHDQRLDKRRSPIHGCEGQSAAEKGFGQACGHACWLGSVWALAAFRP
jgi:hypothetical protein